MDFGLALPTMPAGASPDGILAAADAAERLGWDSVWASDHVIVGHADAAEFSTIYEAITTLAFVGARFPRLRLGTSVLVVPQRDAVLVAKEIATLDALTGGRVELGVGVGTNETEYDNLGRGDRYRVRGAYLDEAIRLWRHLFSGSEAPFIGRFHRLEDFTFGPLPAQRERLPILVGGRTPAAFARAALLGDGYQSAQVGPTDFGGRASTVQQMARGARRAAPRLSARVGVRFVPPPASGRYRLAGSASDMLRDVAAFDAAGCGRLVVAFGEAEPDRVVAAVERFHREVVEPWRRVWIGGEAYA